MSTESDCKLLPVVSCIVGWRQTLLSEELKCHVGPSRSWNIHSMNISLWLLDANCLFTFRSIFSVCTRKGFHIISVGWPQGRKLFTKKRPCPSSWMKTKKCWDLHWASLSNSHYHLSFIHHEQFCQYGGKRKKEKKDFRTIKIFNIYVFHLEELHPETIWENHMSSHFHESNEGGNSRYDSQNRTTVHKETSVPVCVRACSAEFYLYNHARLHPATSAQRNICWTFMFAGC